MVHSVSCHKPELTFSKFSTLAGIFKTISQVRIILYTQIHKRLIMYVLTEWVTLSQSWWEKLHMNILSIEIIDLVKSLHFFQRTSNPTKRLPVCNTAFSTVRMIQRRFSMIAEIIFLASSTTLWWIPRFVRNLKIIVWRRQFFRSLHKKRKMSGTPSWSRELMLFGNVGWSSMSYI